MNEDFIDWFFDRLETFLIKFYELLKDAMRLALAWLIAIFFFPVWIIPFIYWYFFKRNKEADNEKN